jgi:hypothetical protein
MVPTGRMVSFAIDHELGPLYRHERLELLLKIHVLRIGLALVCGRLR